MIPNDLVNGQASFPGFSFYLFACIYKYLVPWLRFCHNQVSYSVIIMAYFQIISQIWQHEWVC